MQTSLEHFANSLETSPHGLRFAGFILAPDSIFSPGPIETVSPEIWADTFNTRLLHSIATIQAFLRLIISHKSRILVLTPTITSSLRLPFNGLETTSIAALDAFTGTLSAEMQPLGVSVCQIKIGNFNLDQFGRDAILRNASSETISWPAPARTSYAKAYLSMTGSARSLTRGSPLRELHNTVFDLLTQKSVIRRTRRVGRGSLLYPGLGIWMPQGLVAWMMGYRMN